MVPGAEGLPAAIRGEAVGRDGRAYQKQQQQEPCRGASPAADAAAARPPDFKNLAQLVLHLV